MSPRSAVSQSATDTTPERPLDQSLRLARPLIPPAMAGKLAALHLHTLRDLCFYFPRRYNDFSHAMSLKDLREKPPEGPVTATVEVVDLRVEPGFRRRIQRTVARLRDETGEGEAIWFGRRYIERRLAVGQHVAISGKVELRGWLPRFQNPDFGPAGGESLNAGRIVPVYRLTAGLTLPTLRAKINAVLDDKLESQPEYLSTAVRADVEPEAGPLVGIHDAVRWVHFPPDFERRDDGLRRLAFDELLALQIGMVARQRERQSENSLPIKVTDTEFGRVIDGVEQVIAQQVAARRARAGLEIESDAAVALTVDQRAALDDIRTDLAGARPMMRLLQGDVGSGKTAVAAVAMAVAAANDHQAALLAPTDLLARQHAQTLQRLLEPLGHDVTLLTGSLPQAQRNETLDLLGAPTRSIEGRSRGRVVVGTHALVQDAVAFADLRLVVVDEQHRFGVAEREALTSKGSAPHVLLMTATPIPRTLGQIVHADLDVSDLRTSPAGRQEIGTRIRTSGELVRRKDGKQGALALIAQEVAKGHRAFVVVPLVEDDPAAGARSVEAGASLVRDNWKAATEVARIDLPMPEIEIVHGQMKASERDHHMERFRSGAVPIVVGTTVLEVGVDVPEATVMMVLDADRFGLAQLHQLRGRVGRGEAQSYCVLVTDRYPEQGDDDVEKATVKARLDALEKTTDGFALAELDLEQRREGELLGLSQSGLPPLRVASLSNKADQRMSLRARQLAERIVGADGRLSPHFAALQDEITYGWLARVGAGEVLKTDDDG